MSDEPDGTGENSEGSYVPPHGGETLVLRQPPIPGDVAIKISPRFGHSDRFSMGTQDLPVTYKIPVHKHLDEDEIPFVHRGSGTGLVQISGLKPVYQTYGSLPWMLPVTEEQYRYLNQRHFAFLGSDTSPLSICDALAMGAPSTRRFADRFFVDDPHYTEPSQGDGFLPYGSLRYFTTWREPPCHIQAKAFPGRTHYNILQDQEFLDTVLGLLKADMRSAGV